MSGNVCGMKYENIQKDRVIHFLILIFFDVALMYSFSRLLVFVPKAHALLPAPGPNPKGSLVSCACGNQVCPRQGKKVGRAEFSSSPGKV